MRSAPARRRPRQFDPAPYEPQLRAILEGIASTPGLDDRELDRLLKDHPKDGRGLFSRSELIAGYRRFGTGDEGEFVERLRLRPVRTQSGVTPVTVLTKPFPCPGRCIFCPNDVRMPKSYLSDEPGAQRAEDNRFDPYLQTWNRLDAYRQMGHPIGKVELIVLGGTWSFYPEPYQIWFVARCFEAMNDFGARLDGRAEALDEEQAADWERLVVSQRANETAPCRNVGLSVETRPDHVDAAEIRRIRRLGGTKVQIGLQSLSDAVLSANRRGCDVAASRRALRGLRAAGFKIHAHWMANLLGSTPKRDAEDYARLFEDPDFRPDEVKLYPCSLIETAELMTHYERGEWRPYERDELLDLLVACLAATPEYCRLTRVIRDFSAADIVAGNRIANLREVAEAELVSRGGTCRDIRTREIRSADFDPTNLALRTERYETSIGEEHFLSLVTPDDRLVAFLRLSLPADPDGIEELRRSALLREVHVYGASLNVGRREQGRPQHEGLGRRLIGQATTLASNAGYETLSVISAVGTRDYYRNQGFTDGALYQHLRLS